MISIIEQFKNIIKTELNKNFIRLNLSDYEKDELKKISIIMPKGFTAEKYMDEFFKMEKSYNQCTNMEYFKNSKKNLDKDYEEFIYKNKLKDCYRFITINDLKTEFTNLSIRINKHCSTIYDDSPHLWYFIKKKIFNKIYNNTVYTFDEIHNYTSNDEELNSKKQNSAVSIFMNIFSKYVGNMKLLLLTATPMYHNYTELLFLINIFLRNDNRPNISQYEKDILKNFIENDVLDPNINLIFRRLFTGYISFLKKDIKKIPLNLSPKAAYKKKLTFLNLKNNKFIKNFDNERIIKDTNKITDLCIIISEMVGYQRNRYTKEKSKNTKYQISNIAYPQNLNKKEIYDLKYLKNYSTKIFTIIKIIKESINQNGIIFIYSRLINFGVKNLQEALTYNGITDIESSIKSQFNYIVISGTMQKSKRLKIFQKCFSKENIIDNPKIKIIIGTDVISEGWDMKAIRQIHILEPWWNISKLKQIIGRGVRTNSHKLLNEDEKNLVIYLHASVIKDSTIESVDLYRYRLSILRHKKILKLESVIKSNSIDCMTDT